MTTNDIDAIRHLVFAYDVQGDADVIFDKDVFYRSYAAKAHLLARRVPALCDEIEQLRAQLAGRDQAITQHLDDKARMGRHIDGLENQLAHQQPAINALREWAREDPAREGYDRVCQRLIEAVDALAELAAERARTQETHQ